MIPITLLECTLYSDYPIDLGANPGSSLRGALYETLAAMYDTGDSAKSRHDSETNPVAWLLRLEDEVKTGGKDAPRPIAIRPPRPEPGLLSAMSGSQSGATTAFVIALYGRARDVAGLIVSAVASTGGIGMGRGRERGAGRYTLRRVRALDPLTGQGTEIVDMQGRQIAELPSPPSAEAYAHFAALLQADRLSVQFITPTRIIDHQALCKQPAFRPWFQRLLERIRQISDLYAEPVWIPFAELLGAADVIQTADDQTYWQELWSHSRIDGMYKPVSGFVGKVEYTGEFDLLLPYLLVGQSLQVGKNAIKGGGWYEMTYRWR
ncbi:MAG: CRISPR system precrRNA processing endoribonuclease RAMP protein Cas6 [Anaerolineae bacterium]|nr:CRISPR system precrRNA processing endoribonuclease RAMP protein Cas6 [Anaerolineae bacterium]